jgi:cyclomaltodextrinase / maltogenic alpha-amylase / neopullulanase
VASAPGGRARVGALLALMMALLPGCTSGGRGDGRAASPRFDQRGGDAFAWSEPVSGSAGCAEVTLLVNGRPLAEGANVPVKDGRFSAVVPIGEGRNRIVARCAQAAEGGESAGESAALEFAGRLKARPTAWIRVSVDGDTVTLDGGHSEPAQPDGARVVRYAWSPDPRHPAPLTTAAGGRFGGEVGGPRLELRAPTEDGEYHMRLTVTDAEGRADTSTTYFAVEGGKARAVDLAREHPRWIDSAVVYAPVPALWGDDGPAAVERHLEYLKRLGVDALWLWPPAEERAAGEEYAITDYFRLDPSWGPPAAFSSMVDKAHKLGMRVLLDIVPNHLSDQSPYFQDAGRYGKASHYWGFFDRDANGEPTHYFDWTNLPNLDYDNPEVRRMVVEAFSHWVRDLGIDGFRVDAAWGVQRRRPDFWPALRRQLKRIDPDVLLLAEASATDPYFFSHGFDAAYDWTDELGQWAWTSVFDSPREIRRLLAAAVTNDPKGYAPGAIVLRFLNNNDTDVRFVDQHGPGLTRVAATLQFTLPGMPALFAGDEIGASYQPYSDLTPIPWQDRHHLRPLYQRLIGLRHRVPALSGHHLELVGSTPDSSFAYLRPAPPGGEPVLVVLNFGGRAAVELRRTPQVDAALGQGGARDPRDLLGDRPVRVEAGPGTVTIPMGAESAYLLTPGAG